MTKSQRYVEKMNAELSQLPGWTIVDGLAVCQPTFYMEEYLNPAQERVDELEAEVEELRGKLATARADLET
jgi:hypothetical protein